MSVLTVRRYGYNFADAVTGSQGEIFFGEHDRDGYLWLYLPSVEETGP